MTYENHADFFKFKSKKFMIIYLFIAGSSLVACNGDTDLEIIRATDDPSPVLQQGDTNTGAIYVLTNRHNPVEQIRANDSADYTFVSNTPDGVISSYTVDSASQLTRLASEAGNAGVSDDETQNGGGVLDAEVVFPYLYQVVNNDSRIAQWQINPDGSLERMLSIEIVDTELLRPRTFVGIAGF